MALKERDACPICGGELAAAEEVVTFYSDCGEERTMNIEAQWCLDCGEFEEVA